ncbi:helix-turn-helix transcriptional regulator [Brevundimonas sp. VNH65]|uniref:helix-turn-helix transcriptional regulator n=1 Tax=Brevundimonas sp. VNH65 TaxID=3400917 RepID=UPI003C07A0FF
MAEEAKRFITIPEFCRRSTLCRQSVYNLIDRGDISRPIKISPNRVAFPAEVVDAWFASKVEAA